MISRMRMSTRRFTRIGAVLAWSVTASIADRPCSCPARITALAAATTCGVDR